jgi:SUKH-4 immunity protein
MSLYTFFKADQITFLSDEEVALNLSNEDLAFLHEVGLPKRVNSLDWAFDLSNIKKYTGIDKISEQVSFYKKSDPNDSIILYKIGMQIIADVYICIQESDGAVYIAEKPSANEDPEFFLDKVSYFNSNVKCFARCLNVYDTFYRNNEEVMNDDNIKTNIERRNILVELSETLRNIDNTIVGSIPGELNYDGYWSYIIEQMYDVFGIDLYDEDHDHSLRLNMTN